MKKVMGILLMLMMSISSVYGQSSYERYWNELKRLRDPQISNLLLTYLMGAREDLGLVLTSIVWKESMFGKYTVNKDDGVYGSYGLAQILLTTSASRNKVTTKEARKELELRLLTDPKFNLNEAIAELTYWRKQYKGKTQYWVTHMVASYNNGWKGNVGKGEAYAKDAKLRRKVFVDFFKDKNNLKHPVYGKYLLAIRDDLVRQKMIKE